MVRNKKISSEYVILGIAWLFWGISQSLLWYEESRKPNMVRILSTVPLQTMTCIVFNFIAIQCMIAVQKKIVGTRRQFTWFALIIVVFSLLLVLVNSSIYQYIRGSDKIIQSLSMYLIYGTEKMIYLTGFCTMFFLIRNLKEFKIQKSIAEEAQQTARNTQMQMLQQQLSPHFLFNTLNSLRSLITIDANRARNMVTDLSEFLRVTLASYKSVQNTIQNEVSLIDYYLKIQKVRFENDLDYQIHIDDILLQFTIPKYILQPLVENAVKFGMQTSPMPLKIHISAIQEDNIVKIVVENTGRLVVENNESHCNNGIQNTKIRLELMFPGKSDFILTERDGIVRVEIFINHSEK